MVQVKMKGNKKQLGPELSTKKILKECIERNLKIDTDSKKNQESPMKKGDNSLINGKRNSSLNTIRRCMMSTSRTDIKKHNKEVPEFKTMNSLSILPKKTMMKIHLLPQVTSILLVQLALVKLHQEVKEIKHKSSMTALKSLIKIVLHLEHQKHSSSLRVHHTGTR